MDDLLVYVGITLLALNVIKLRFSVSIEVLDEPLVSSLLPYGLILVAHILRSFAIVISPLLLQLEVLVVYLVLPIDVGNIIGVDIVIKNMRPALLILVHVII